jgi:transposase
LSDLRPIKVLPAHLAEKPELRERFEREALTLASYGQGGASKRQRCHKALRGRDDRSRPDCQQPSNAIGDKVLEVRHLICDGHGVPLAIQLTGANRNDSQQALALVDAIPPLQGVLGRPRYRPDSVLGDPGYDAEAIRQGLRERGIVPLLAMRNTEHGSGLGRWRWVVERSFAWLNQFRRLRSATRSEPIFMKHF